VPSGPLIATRLIVNSVLSSAPSSIVDLGMGTGKYGFLLREQHDLAGEGQDRLRLVGVEAWEPYVGEHQRVVYDEIVVDDIRSYLAAQPNGCFDVALALDVIEHFPPAGGVRFLAEAVRVADRVILSTPRSFYAQEGHDNTLERHLSWWPPRKLRAAARSVGAQIAIFRDRLTVVAMLSSRTEPGLSTERTLEAANRLRSLVVPDRIYYPLRRKTGPTI
jgi:hypothetical protein